MKIARRWLPGMVILAVALTVAASADAAPAPAPPAAKKKPVKAKKPAKSKINKNDGVTYTDEPFRLKHFVIPAVNGKLVENPGWKGKDGYGLFKRTDRNAPYQIRIPVGSTATYQFDWNGQKAYAKFDLNGDGKYVGKYENPSVNRAGAIGPLTIRAAYSDGSRAPYTFYFVNPDEDTSGRMVAFYRACCRRGKLKLKGDYRAIPIEIYDDNNNGLFDDYGADSVKLDGKWLYLSQLVMLRGRLYHMRVTPSALHVFLKAYEGKTGQVDLLSGFKRARGLKLGSVLVKAKAGANSFDVAPASKTAKSAVAAIPVGSYAIVGGYLKKGRLKLRIGAGSMKAFEVKQDESLVVKWGAPFELRGTIGQDVRGIVVRGAGIYGSAGVYFAIDESPPIVVVRRNSATGQILKKGPMKYDKTGKLETWFWNPVVLSAKFRRGVFYVTLEQSSRILGRLKSQPKRLAFKSMY